MDTLKKTLTIMLIDDSRENRNLFWEIISSIDPEIHYAPEPDAETGLQALHTMPTLPDYIFLDIHLPKIDGWECLLEIKKIERARGIPVYFYSSTVQPSELERIQSSGAQFLLQSSDLNECVVNVAKILKEDLREEK
jgi:CheY-like chemotaxis protein